MSCQPSALRKSGMEKGRSPRRREGTKGQRARPAAEISPSSCLRVFVVGLNRSSVRKGSERLRNKSAFKTRLPLPSLKYTVRRSRGYRGRLVGNGPFGPGSGMQITLPQNPPLAVDAGKRLHHARVAPRFYREHPGRSDQFRLRPAYASSNNGPLSIGSTSAAWVRGIPEALSEPQAGFESSNASPAPPE